MSWQDAISNAVTLGGHQKLQVAQADYSEIHRRYLLKFENERVYRARLDESIKSLGSLTVESFKSLKKASKLVALGAKLAYMPTRNTALPVSEHPILPTLDRVKKLVVRYSEVQNAAGGLGAGSIAAIGSWSAVSLLASASTGTAISTLSGVAATNATLAWFGGGALAAGGAGMAGGAALLGGIVIAPVIAFMSWQSRAKAEKYTSESNRIGVELHKLSQMIDHLAASIMAVTTATNRLAPPAQELTSKYLLFRQTLFPIPLISFTMRQVRSWFGAGFYRSEELPLLEELSVTIASFESLWGTDLRDLQPSTALR